MASQSQIGLYLLHYQIGDKLSAFHQNYPRARPLTVVFDWLKICGGLWLVIKNMCFLVFRVKHQKYKTSILSPFFQPDPSLTKTDVPAHEFQATWTAKKGSSSVESVQRLIASSSFSISVSENKSKKKETEMARRGSEAKKHNKKDNQNKHDTACGHVFWLRCFPFPVIAGT